MTPDAPGEDEVGFGPQADLFFTLAALLLLVLLALLPGMVASGAKTSAKPLDQQVFKRAGRRIEPFLAFRYGLARGIPPRRLGLDAIASDADLAQALRRMVTSGETPVLLIAPDGLEAAFEFDALAGSLGIEKLDQVRLAADCRVNNSDAIQECARPGAAADR